MLTKVSFIGIALMAKGAGETGVSWFHLTSKMIFQLGIVGKEAAAGWTGHHLLMCVGSGVLKNFGLVPTMKRAVFPFAAHAVFTHRMFMHMCIEVTHTIKYLIALSVVPLAPKLYLQLRNYVLHVTVQLAGRKSLLNL